ncbi:THO complex subunit 1 transcription elongation factor-domain-containing protein [Dunaliella salina]|uniref:THO complex subunit 1 transcription elongation factor-domain-containing protein n=1 Tax=Dunaliella salina TaxID=3046 RepID=A0ABQ7H4D5_DUNSA|nr:THO complex subunit 1 transcription elongation factor-domain-containing protein [Dunaliella salina]|eukprot:KAF5841715.1 THO complex subunit 1 transcription elongation factor-domain-containing protein [Dunaliella salina]
MFQQCLTGSAAPCILPVDAQIENWCDVTYYCDGAPHAGPTAPPIRLVEIASYCKLIEDLLELGTIQDNMGVFMHIEHLMVELMSKEVGTASPARLCILRSCNNLLRRLSKSQDLQLCGRILVFIARIYPLGDKSGVNLQGTVNSGLSLPIDEVSPGDKDSNGEPIDAKLYTTFWGLQNVFKNPQSILQQSVWAKAVQDMSLVLEEMDKKKVTVKAGYSFSQAPTQQGAEGAAGAADAHTTSTVKYLSSSKLFGLQMRDASFRRQFLVQCAALLHCTQKPGKLVEKVASSSSTFEGAQELSNRVFAAMAKTEECGADFANAVRHILKHEDEWVSAIRGEGAVHRLAVSRFDRRPPFTCYLVTLQVLCTLPVVSQVL